MKYTNSNLVTYDLLVKSHGGRRNHKIDSVAIHCMGMDMTLQECEQTFSDSSKSSVNYGIDSQGKIALYVEEENRAYATSDKEVDNRAISVIVASRKSKQPYEITDNAYKSLINLLADVCYRNDFTLKWKNDKTYGIAAAAKANGAVDEQNIFLHKWFSSSAKECPGNYIIGKLPDIVSETNAKISQLKADAKKQAAQKKKEDAKETSTPTTETTEITIDVKSFTPYIATFTRESPDMDKVDLKAMKKAGVFGCMVEAGKLFTSNHTKYSNFRSPKAYDQVKAILDSGMKHAYYMKARARNASEVRDEMNELYYMVAKYPPALGMWLRLDLTSSVKTNNKLIEEYQVRLIDMGLKNKIGFYVTSKELKQITWDNFVDDWLLWVIKHVSDLNSIDGLMDPAFFDMDGEG